VFVAITANELHTGEVTSWTKCLSIQKLVSCSAKERRSLHTDVEQNCAVESLIYDMVLENLIVESLRTTVGSGHDC
jgi:hypothetical protein